MGPELGASQMFLLSHILLNALLSKQPHRTVNLDYEVHCHPDTKEDLSPIVISHALYGCKTDWMAIGKELNYVTKRKVCAVSRVLSVSYTHLTLPTKRIV